MVSLIRLNKLLTDGAYATSLKVGGGGARLAKVGDQGFSPLTAALKLLASQK